MICLKKVNAENIWDILSLSVDECIAVLKL